MFGEGKRDNVKKGRILSLHGSDLFLTNDRWWPLRGLWGLISRPPTQLQGHQHSLQSISRDHPYHCITAPTENVGQATLIFPMILRFQFCTPVYECISNGYMKNTIELHTALSVSQQTHFQVNWNNCHLATFSRRFYPKWQELTPCSSVIKPRSANCQSLTLQLYHAPTS